MNDLDVTFNGGVRDASISWIGSNFVVLTIESHERGAAKETAAKETAMP